MKSENLGQDEKPERRASQAVASTPLGELLLLHWLTRLYPGFEAAG